MRMVAVTPFCDDSVLHKTLSCQQAYFSLSLSLAGVKEEAVRILAGDYSIS
jgi:hypothetical protein